MSNEIRCISNKIEKAWTVKGRRVCIATHPKQPNISGNSRGRKIHLQKTDSMTICNMLIDGFIPMSDKNWSMVYNGKCKICFKIKQS